MEILAILFEMLNFGDRLIFMVVFVFGLLEICWDPSNHGTVESGIFEGHGSELLLKFKVYYSPTIAEGKTFNLVFCNSVEYIHCCKRLRRKFCLLQWWVNCTLDFTFKCASVVYDLTQTTEANEALFQLLGQLERKYFEKFEK